MSTAPAAVTVRRESVVLPTYEPHAPDRNPMFLEKRVYQGSGGGVYPLPFTDRIAEKPTPRAWDAVYVENEFLAVMILPELGGRIHRATDKTNGYDLIYHQTVIKPALVGLAGPWVSGGIEFNWPQHHRPSTFMPAEVAIEHGDDGSVTVWLSEHDPMARMKGMHGVCLRPGRALLELKARVYNRTADVQTFLWWANVATRVHERYQSFFPPDTTYVADHAKRAMSTFPRASGHYYGVDYGTRARDGVPAGERPRQYPPIAGCAANDLSWYANIPVPTSYMCMGSREDFCGGYDHAAEAGLVHVASHHISPGKKQWTWGNHEFGYAWDRNLTDADARGEHAPYIELMAGVYTDNQPDFSHLLPGETKTWTQCWYPIRAIGPAQHANAAAAISLRPTPRAVRIGVAVTAVHPGARITLTVRGKTLAAVTRDLSPAAPWVETVALPRTARLRAGVGCTLSVTTADGRELIGYTPRDVPPAPVPPAATEPPAPAAVASADELFLIGQHLEQYRHATRCPTLYWREALRRDAGDARCHLALGRWHLRRGEFAEAEGHFRASIARLTARNANPADGEPFYQLGLCLRQLGRDDEAYDAFYKSTWNQAWQSAAYHALAEIDCTRADWTAALDHLDRSLRLNTDHLRARNLRVLVLRRLGRDTDAAAQLAATLALDPLDAWARHLRGDALPADTQICLDLALDYLRAGFHVEARELLATTATAPVTAGTAPLLHYYRAWTCNLLGYTAELRRALDAAENAAADYCFPARLEEIAILRFAMAEQPRAARAPFYLGNLLYARRRHREAIALWERAVQREPANAVAWRNLGIGAFNILRRPALARRAYDAALRANPRDARLLFERDQLWKRLGVAPARRLRALEKFPDLLGRRDDLAVELCALFNQLGRPEDALTILSTRRFQPWEGGEGQALGQHTRTHVLLGRAALAAGDAAAARREFSTALGAPENLGEARHLLANTSDLHFWLGEACAADGDTGAAREHWKRAATARGDFQEMRVRTFSEMTYFSALALRRLGRTAAAEKLLRALLHHAQTRVRELARTPAQVDYFATSLPTMLLFDDDLTERARTAARFLEAQARHGLGQRAAARRLLKTVLRHDPAHALARDLLA